MTKELEALEQLEQDIKGRVILAEDRQLELCAVIKQALLELQAIKEAKPETLEWLSQQIQRLNDDLQHYTMVEKDKAIEYQISEDLKELNTIKATLLKAEKLEKAWEILKPLCEVVETPVRKDRYLKINGVVIYTFKDREEFELIKEMLE